MYRVNNKVNGNAFEELIELSLEFYRKQKIACILKTPEPFKTIAIAEKGKVTGFYEKKAQPDYKGVLCNGQCIIFEAKSTINDRILQSAVTEIQTKLLNEHQELNALCFVMASMEYKYFYRVPWDVWISMKERFGHKYMTKDELRPYQIKEYHGRLLLLDGIELSKI